MQQRADDLHLHALAQRKVAHRLIHERLQFQQLDEFVARALEIGHRDLVDRPVELERVQCRNVPLQLIAIAHYQRDLLEELLFALFGDVSQHPHFAAGGVEQA